MRRAPALLLLLVLLSPPALPTLSVARPLGSAFLVLYSSLPQSTNASLSGRITDPSKAFIADAKIAAVSTATNFRYETTTNISGEYYLANLPPGLYQVEIEKPGFKKLIKPDVILHVQDALEINFEMIVGDVTENITVEAGLLPVETASATVSTVIDRTFVENLPLNGRSFQTLIMLTPGVVVTATAFDDQGQFSVNGQRPDANYFTVDGVSANFGVAGYFPLVQAGGGALPALSVSGGTNSLVSIDAMQEFRIQTSSFAPEFGRTPGGQISVVTRSGTNAFHGTLFEYFRNDVLDARDWFTNFNHLPKPAERQNDFGGVFGGPLIKDRTFFFFSYEGLRLRQPSTQETDVPDNASRQQAPASMQPFLNAYPLPNGPAAADGSGLAQFNDSFSNPSSLDSYSIRLDQVINSKLTLFGRYNYSPSNLDQRAPLLGTTSFILSLKEAVYSSVQTMTTGLTERITPGISNEVRANYSNDHLGSVYSMDDFGGAVPLPDSLLFPTGVSSKNGAFTLYIPRAGEYAIGKQATDEQRQVNLVDNLSWTKGFHQMKFGVDYRWLSPFSSPFSYRQYAQFLGVTCPTPPSPCTGYALSGTAPGATSTTAQVAASFGDQSDALFAQNFSFYGQDTWKFSSRITLTYGLRWDINPPLKGKNLANQPFTVTGLNNPATLALAPRGTPLYQTTYGNVAPRVGLAYQLRQTPGWGSVLRAGFGTFYDLGYGSLGGASSYFPYISEKIIFAAPFPLSTQNATPPPFSTRPPVIGVLVADPNLKLPRTYEWNFALEQSLGNSQSVSLTYTGALGHDLLRVTDIIGVNPNFPYISLTNNSARSYYHALQLKFQRRLSKGLQALASYSFSHSIDNASTDAFANYLNTPGGGSYQAVDRGDSDFDIRHAFTAGVTYNVPTPGSQKFLHTAFSGWSLDSFILARSAPPVNLVSAAYLAGGTELYPRPDVNPGVPLVLYGSQYPGGKIFNEAAFSLQPSKDHRQGDFGRNVLRGFDAVQTDLGLQRQFQLREKMGLRFRSEFFNIFNHPNFGNPINSLTSSFFGQSTQTLASSLGSGGANGGFNPLYQIGGPRSIQLALKLQF
jgi:carboxypeptidase family protein